jgi:hypothetical protein
MPPTVRVEVPPPRDRELLASWLRSPPIEARLARRARIVLLAADGLGTNKIVQRGRAEQADGDCRKRRCAAEGVGGLEDRPKPGKPADHRSCGDRAAEPGAAAAAPGVTRWSSRLLAAELGLSNVKIVKVWREYGLQPWRAETFKFSTDPQLEAKVRDAIGLYFNPPDRPWCAALMKAPGAGAGAGCAGAAAPAWDAREAQPGLHSARHHHTVRRSRRDYREGHRRLLPPPPP